MNLTVCKIPSFLLSSVALHGSGEVCGIWEVNSRVIVSKLNSLSVWDKAKAAVTGAEQCKGRG